MCLYNYLIAVFAGYLLGTIPFGLLSARLKGIDIRKEGSGNIGATNVWRVCGWRYGLPVFLLDVVKGVTAVYCGKFLAQRAVDCGGFLPVFAGVACIVGHSFPVWLKFKGGKGVATSLGVIFGLMPLASGIVFGLWGIVFKLSGYVSLASVVAAASLPFVVWYGKNYGWGYDAPSLGFAIFASLLVIIRHKSNMQRLIAGTESRFGKKKIQS